VKIEADNQTRTAADLLSNAPIKVRADVRSNLRQVGDIRVHRLSMTARRDENALSVCSSHPRNSVRGSRHGEQLVHDNHARDTLQTAFDRDALIVGAFEQLGYCSLRRRATGPGCRSSA
jgi:hypothetical protein